MLKSNEEENGPVWSEQRICFCCVASFNMVHAALLDVGRVSAAWSESKSYAGRGNC